MIAVWFAVIASVSAEYVPFIGSDGRGRTGAINEAASWKGNQIPSGAKTGLIERASNIWAGSALTDIAVKQAGGLLKSTGGLALRGGPASSGIATVYIIDDPDPNYTAYKNIEIPKGMRLAIWSQHGEKIELSLLSGHIDAGELMLNASGRGVINIKNGIFHADKLVGGKGKMNLLSGGTGTVVIDVLETTLNDLRLNFETESRCSVTFGSGESGGSASGLWEKLIKGRKIQIDGKTVTDPVLFDIRDEGSASTIKLKN